MLIHSDRHHKIQNLNSAHTTSKIQFILLFCILLSGFSAWSQEPVLLSGHIDASNSDVEKIHVINLNLEKGAVTNRNGDFVIMARENDSLYISSVQFQNTGILVTEKMIEEGNLVIKLQNKMNELAEVVIDDIKLSGYLANDLKKISIAEVEAKYKLQNDLNDFIKKDRELNPYEKPVMGGGLRLDLIAGAVIDQLSRNKEKTTTYSSREIANKSISIVGREFFRENLGLEHNEICNFVYFCAEDSRFRKLVLNNNAFVLIEYFQTRIEDFKDMRGSHLNVSNQIPG